VVTVITPGRTTVVGEIKATGTLAARRELAGRRGGRRRPGRRVLVEPGDWVAPGRCWRDRPLGAGPAAGQPVGADPGRAADAGWRRPIYDRALKLVDKGFISKADVDRLTRNPRCRLARCAWQAPSWACAGATRRLNIVAPAAGLVLERRIEPGQVVSGGSGVLFRLAKGGEMELKANLAKPIWPSLRQASRQGYPGRQREARLPVRSGRFRR
jgi:HlyD family secretion protein